MKFATMIRSAILSEYYPMINDLSYAHRPDTCTPFGPRARRGEMAWRKCRCVLRENILGWCLISVGIKREAV